MALFDTWKWFQGSKFGDGWKTPPYSPGSAGDPMGEAAIPANLPMAKPPQKITAPDAVQVGQGDANQQNLDWLARMTGVDMKQAQERWKNKGGFEGLMANPAFTMGLAFMQAGAEGKTLGQGSLDNVIKAAGISSHYKRVIENRKQAPITVTAADVADT